MSSIKLKHSGGNSVSLNPPTSAPTSSEVAFKLPTSDGSAGQVLKTDGSGNLSWVTITDTNDYVKLLDNSGSNLGSSVIFDNLDITTYKYFDLVGTFQPIDDGGEFQFRYRTGGASGADYSGANYNSGIDFMYINNNQSQGTIDNWSRWKLTQGIGNHASEAVSITMRISMAESGDPEPMQWLRNFATWMFTSRDNGNAAEHGTGQGHLYNTGVYPTGFRLYFSNSNDGIAAYDYSLYGIKR